MAPEHLRSGSAPSKTSTRESCCVITTVVGTGECETLASGLTAFFVDAGFAPRWCTHDAEPHSAYDDTQASFSSASALADC